MNSYLYSRQTSVSVSYFAIAVSCFFIFVVVAAVVVTVYFLFFLVPPFTVPL